MSKYGVNLSIDLKKLDKSRFVQGKNGGLYCDLTVFLSPDEPDEYKNHGGITVAQTAEERSAKQPAHYVGNARVFWQENAVPMPDHVRQQQDLAARTPPKQDSGGFVDDDIPFSQHEKGWV